MFVQAACRPLEVSMVAGDQDGSIFTKAFLAAQKRGIWAKIALTLLDQLFVMNFASLALSPPLRESFTPMTSETSPFPGLRVYDSFDDMFIQT